MLQLRFLEQFLHTQKEVHEMATEKTFAVAGVSTHKDGTKIRFANDTMRVKILRKNGHTDINLVDLPREMTKGEIAQFLTESNFAQGNVAVLAAIRDLAKKNKVTTVAAKPTVATKARSPAANQVKTAVKTPQVPAIPGMTPLGLAEVMATPALM